MVTAVGNQGGAMTDDHQWLVFTKEDGWIHVFTFNGA